MREIAPNEWEPTTHANIGGHRVMTVRELRSFLTSIDGDAHILIHSENSNREVMNIATLSDQSEEGSCIVLTLADNFHEHQF